MLCENTTSKLLGMEDVIVKKVWEEWDRRHIEVELPRRMHKCPACGKETDTVHDYREQRVRDMPSYGKYTVLHLSKRRYRCRHCGKRFPEENAFLPRYHQTTTRLVAKVIDDFRELRPAKQIAAENGVSVTTAFRYFGLVSYRCGMLPEVLSIDEFKGNAGGERFQGILTDPKHQRILDILPNRKSEDLLAYFSKFSTRNSVKVVVMDMNKAYLEVVRTCFPKATVVIDKYHVVRQAIWAFENVRKTEQRKFSDERRRYFKRSRSLLTKHPSKLKEEEADAVSVMLMASERLRQAYHLKNKFQEFMWSKSSAEGKKRLAEWILLSELAALPEFKACLTAVHNWDKYILNAFDYPYTNGFTEGCNNKTKVLKRVCFGVRNFSRFRNRILHCAAA